MVSDDVMELQKLFYQTHDYLDSEIKDRILILGIGNYLMGDEGVGVHIIHALSKIDLLYDPMTLHVIKELIMPCYWYMLLFDCNA